MVLYIVEIYYLQMLYSKDSSSGVENYNKMWKGDVLEIQLWRNSVEKGNRDTVVFKKILLVLYLENPCLFCWNIYENVCVKSDAKKCKTN